MHSCRWAAFALIAVFTTPAGAAPEKLSMKECTIRFEAAKQAKTTDIPRWNEYHKSECGIDDIPAPGQTAQVSPKNSAAAPIVPQGVKFPSKIDEKFASEKLTTQRMRTCLEAYHANKAAKTLGELRWVQKGGGYYSLCNARLKVTNP